MKTAFAVLVLVVAVVRWLRYRRPADEVSPAGLERVLSAQPEPTRDSEMAMRYRERDTAERIKARWERPRKKGTVEPFYRPQHRYWRVS